MKTQERKNVTRGTRRKRARPTPRWLKSSTELDVIAQRRCLMVLDVLSGAQPVTDAITKAQISRQMYYQLEEKALKAMISALTPGATETGSDPTSGGRIAALEERLQTMEKEKRRAERLLLLTRKVMGPGTLKTGAGRPPGSRNRRSSAGTGRRASTKSTSLSMESHSTSISGNSTPTKDGASAG
jgi:hypothetical protein